MHRRRGASMNRMFLLLLLLYLTGSVQGRYNDKYFTCAPCADCSGSPSFVMQLFSAVNKNYVPTDQRYLPDYLVYSRCRHFPSSICLKFFGCHEIRFVSSSTGPSLPDDPCITQADCVAMGWMDPLPECANLTCSCPPDTCPVYTTVSGNSEYRYFCGPCGMLGAACKNSTECVVDWQCRNNFCKCDKGFVSQGVCIYFEEVPTSVRTVVLLFILLLIIATQQIISSRKAIRNIFCPSSSENEDNVSRVVASNPQSNNKTAAYTITHTDFMVVHEDPDLAWALELSRRHIEPGASTWSSSASSFPAPDPRFIPPRPQAQAGPSGWRQTQDEAIPQRRRSHSSLSSTSSSHHNRHPSGTVSSCSSSSTPASLRSTSSSVTSSSRPASYEGFKDDMSLPTLESLSMECDVNDFQSTRV